MPPGISEATIHIGFQQQGRVLVMVPAILQQFDGLTFAQVRQQPLSQGPFKISPVMVPES